MTRQERFGRRWDGALVIVVCGGCISALPVQAQQAPPPPPPDAGSVLRQAEPPRPPQLPRPAPQPGTSSSSSTTAAAKGPTLTVIRFEFEGNTRFTDTELAPLLGRFLNRPVSLGELETAAALVAQHYRAAGWLVRAIVPPQQVHQGTVRIKVIEATMGETRFSDDTDPTTLAVKPAQLRESVEAGQPQGKAVYLPGLERGLLLANDLPGVAVQGSQVAGASEGATDVLLTARNDQAVHGDLTADNMGSRGTGTGRVVGRVVASSLLGLGDQLELQAQLSESMRYGRVSGSLPLSAQGLRAGVNFSAMRYTVEQAEFATLRPEGSSRNFGADLTCPLLRSSERNVYAGMALERKELRNSTLAGVTSDYALNNVILKLDGNTYDDLGGGGTSSASLSFVAGRVDLDGSPSQAADAATLATQGRFHAVRYRLARTQSLAGVASGLSLQAVVSGQLASKNLDSAEKIYPGGPYGVRAYPLGEGGGSEGHLLSLDLRWQVPNCGCTVSAFLDWRRLKLNVQNQFPGAPAVNSYSLKGAGLGLTGTVARNTHYQLLLARPLGQVPVSTSSAADDDSVLGRARFWFSLTQTF